MFVGRLPSGVAMPLLLPILLVLAACNSHDEKPTIEFLQEVANEYNKTLPKPVSSDTTLVNTAVRSDRTMIFRYAIDADSSTYEGFLTKPDVGRRFVLNGACSAPGGLYLRMGIPLLYIYVSSTGEYIAEFEINDATCGEVTR